MRRLLLRVLLLTVPWLGLWVGAEVLLWKRVRNPFTEKLDALQKQRSSTEILVLGNSHIYRGVLPARLGRPAFNGAQFSQSLYYDAEFGIRCIERLPSLKLIIQPVSYFSLESHLDAGIEAWRIYQYSLFYGIQPRDWRMMTHVRNFSLVFSRGREEGIKSLLSPARFVQTQDQFGGTVRWPKKNIPPEESAEARIALHHEAMRPSNIGENLSHMRRLADAAKKQNIRFVIITSPTSRAYRDRMNPAAYSRMQATLSEFTRKEDVGYWNFSDATAFTDADYSDADHLNQKGAEKLSDLLREEVVFPILKGSSMVSVASDEVTGVQSN